MSDQVARSSRYKEQQEYENRWQTYLNRTHDRLLKVLEPELREDDVILDASCGTGLLVHKLLQRAAPFKELVLNDISPRMLGFAQSRLSNDSRLSYTSHSAEDLPFEENRFTKVLCINVLHKYERPSVAVRQFKDVLKPNGKLYVLDWNRKGWFRLVNTVIRWYDDQNVHSMSLREVNQMLREHRFRIEYENDWRYFYWRLYLTVGGFQNWKDHR